jgi:hypothetical protein
MPAGSGQNERTLPSMSDFFIPILIVFALFIAKAMYDAYQETRADALKKGHGRKASDTKALAYVAVAIFALALLWFAPSIVKTIGLGWTLALFLVIGIGWSQLKQRLFDKKPESGEEK